VLNMKVIPTILMTFFWSRYHAVQSVILQVQICGFVCIADAIKLDVERLIMIIAPCITRLVQRTVFITVVDTKHTDS
jgi:hypothetical protein